MQIYLQYVIQHFKWKGKIALTGSKNQCEYKELISEIKQSLQAHHKKKYKISNITILCISSIANNMVYALAV